MRIDAEAQAERQRQEAELNLQRSRGSDSGNLLPTVCPYRHYQLQIWERNVVRDELASYLTNDAIINLGTFLDIKLLCKIVL